MLKRYREKNACWTWSRTSYNSRDYLLIRRTDQIIFETKWTPRVKHSWSVIQKSTALFNLIYFFGSFCVYYIPHNYVIPQAMPHAIPQLISPFTSPMRKVLECRKTDLRLCIDVRPYELTFQKAVLRSY